MNPYNSLDPLMSSKGHLINLIRRVPTLNNLLFGLGRGPFVEGHDLA